MQVIFKNSCVKYLIRPFSTHRMKKNFANFNKISTNWWKKQQNSRMRRTSMSENDAKSRPKTLEIYKFVSFEDKVHWSKGFVMITEILFCLQSLNWRTEQIICSWAFGLLLQMSNSFEAILIENQFLTLNWCISHGFAAELLTNQSGMHFTLRGFMQITFNKGELLFELLRLFNNTQFLGTYGDVVLAYKAEIVAFFNVIWQIVDELNYEKDLKDHVSSTGTVRKLHHAIELRIFRWIWLLLQFSPLFLLFSCQFFFCHSAFEFQWFSLGCSSFYFSIKLSLKYFLSEILKICCQVLKMYQKYI